MAVERKASVTWQGDLASGSGTITGTTSGALEPLDVSWPARTEEPGGKTSPEELIAAAHAACYAMAFSHALAQGGHRPTRLDVDATTHFDQVGEGFKIVAIDLRVRGEVPNLDSDGFVEAARQGEEGCPVSNALRQSVQIRLDAALA
jgi:lipoyl-dependent peroxiredoxin